MRSVAFYLPQFHQIPENDDWWGEGFTEWTNVRRARPQFHGHMHPRRPGMLGEYDLTNDSVLRAQTELARMYDIDAFCIYFYWFDGQRLLERPVEAWRQDQSLLPYFLSWANESWTRRWDGKAQDVLMFQGYEPGFETALFADLLPHFRAPHYVLQDGRPILVVHRATAIPDPRSTTDKLRRCAVDAGLTGLHLVAAETTPGLRPEPIGFDAVVEFPPVGANTLKTARLAPVRGVASDFRGRLMSYDRLVKYHLSRADPKYVRYRTVVPGWDNTARRQEAATVYLDSTPAKYARWLHAARSLETSDRGAAGLAFINAWNEWAEGAYLEPDEHNGFAYLEATRVEVDLGGVPQGPTSRGIFWSLSHIRSIALATAGSIFALLRRMRNRVR